MSTDKVLVFRKRLLSYSETFIADQGGFLPDYEAVFTGYQKDSSGIELLKGKHVELMDRYSRFIELSKLGYRLGLSRSSVWTEQLKKLNPKVIHAHFLNDGLDALLLARHLSLPLITTLHGHDITKSEKKSWFSKGSADLFKQVDRVIAVSDYIAGHALRKGCPEHKLIQHSIGIDLQRFTQQKHESHAPGLLFVGRLTEKKGCTYLLQAMKRLAGKYPELQLTIVGDGALKKPLQQEAESYSLNVEFVGRETAQQIRERLAGAWLFVAPSITADNGDAEGLGMVFLEAQALHTPVVSFRSGGVVEAVEDEVTGLLCEEKDVATLAENIDSLLSSETLRREFGARGRARVEQRFDIRKQCQLLETIYDEVRNG